MIPAVSRTKKLFLVCAIDLGVIIAEAGTVLNQVPENIILEDTKKGGGERGEVGQVGRWGK
jgi:hypothetical protein